MYVPVKEWEFYSSPKFGWTRLCTKIYDTAAEAKEALRKLQAEASKIAIEFGLIRGLNPRINSTQDKRWAVTVNAEGLPEDKKDAFIAKLKEILE